MTETHHVNAWNGAAAEEVAIGVTDDARRGAAWSLGIALVAFPLPFLRNFFLAELDDTTLLAGRYALLLLFIQAIYTFCFPGGKNVFPAYFPKITNLSERSGFVSGFIYLVLVVAALTIVVTTIWPGLLNLMMGGPGDSSLSTRMQWLLRALVPFALLSVLASSIVTGDMSFVAASVLQRTQLFMVTAMCCVLYFAPFGGGESETFPILVATVFASSVVTMIVSAMLLMRSVKLTTRVWFPPGVFRFSAWTYLDTVMVFAYTAIDQYFIVYKLGQERLGVYFLLLSMARLIPMAVQQLGHLLLATFSKLIGSDAEERLESSYRRVSKLTVGFYAAVSVVVIFYSRPLAGIFGDSCAAHHSDLIWLSLVMNIDALRTINGMTLMAYERMSWVLLSKVFQIIVQLAFTFLLIEPMGVTGVIVAKGLGHVVSAVALMIATATAKQGRKLIPPPAYLAGQIIVIAAATLAVRTDGRGWMWSTVAVVISWGAILLTGRFRGDDLRALIPRKRTKRGGVGL